MTTLQIHHDNERGLFSAEVDGHGLDLEYLRSGERLIFSHTGTAPALRGRGLAGQMVEHALQWAAPLGLQIVPSCSYVASYLRRYPQWQRLTERADVQQVLNFWFGTVGGPEDEQVRSDWFRKSAHFDLEISTRFGVTIAQAMAGHLREWNATPLGTLARIVVLDQFTRNGFRDDPRAFAGDALALQASLALLDSGDMLKLNTLQRWFALMPLEHSEDLAMQQRSVREFEALAEADPRLVGALDYARKHLDVIARFGRFPHRNKVLGRTSTPDELTYLAQPGAGF